MNALILFYQFVMKVKTKLSETRDKEDAKKLIEKGKDAKDTKVNPYTPSKVIPDFWTLLKSQNF